MNAKRQAQLLIEVVNQTEKTLFDIDRLNRSGRATVAEILHRMVDEVESSFVHLGLSGQQESELADRLRNAIHETVGLFDNALAIDGHLNAVRETLRFATRGERSETILR
jgi:hypothetical protein